MIKRSSKVLVAKKKLLELLSATKLMVTIKSECLLQLEPYSNHVT